MRKAVTLSVVLGAVIAVAWLLTPAELDNSAAVPELPADIDRWLADSERAASAVYELVPGTEKRVRWQADGVRTLYSVVYLHGFSATRQEIAPTTEMVADALAANLYEARLSGHGHGKLPMEDVRAENWLQDGVDAISIGAAIGDRVVVIGTSTGATLALALIGHPVMQNVDALVLISPNIALPDPSSEWLTRPAGPLIARLMLGETRSWTPHNEQQALYWTTSYPTAAVVEVMRLVNRARSQLTRPINQDLLVLLSPEDEVVSPEASRRAYDAIEAPRKKLVEIAAEDPSSHVLAGDILSPGTTAEVAALIAGFIAADN